MMRHASIVGVLLVASHLVSALVPGAVRSREEVREGRRLSGVVEHRDAYSARTRESAADGIRRRCDCSRSTVKCRRCGHESPNG